MVPRMLTKLQKHTSIDSHLKTFPDLYKKNSHAYYATLTKSAKIFSYHDDQSRLKKSIISSYFIRSINRCSGSLDLFPVLALKYAIQS